MSNHYGIDVNKKALHKLIADFHTITGQRSGVFDANFNCFLEYPKELTPFCKAVRASEAGASKCRECDILGIKKALKAKGTVVYRCHAGLLEVCAPVLDGGTALGFIVFGQIIYDKNIENEWREVHKGSYSYFTDVNSLRTAFEQVRKVSVDYIESASHLLTALAEYVRYEHLFKSNPNDLWGEILRYIKDNYHTSFQLADMAKQLNVSVSTICQTAKKHTGNTIGQVTLNIRIDKAYDLLGKSNLPIFEIARKCGIPDYNYFSRLFKKQTGKTPTQYRKEKL